MRWRTLLMLAVALVAVSTAVVAGAAWLIPGIGIPAAIALGAMVAPPDPVPVDSIAGRVRMPRRLITVLQSEGLFNDAAAIVIFQAAVAVRSGNKIGPDVVLQFVVGAAVAVGIGIGTGWFTSLITRLVQSLVAQRRHAAGPVCRVHPRRGAACLRRDRRRRHRRGDQAAFTAAGRRRAGHPHGLLGVVELLATGLAFGLVGLEIRQVVREEGAAVLGMAETAAVVCVLVFAVRFGWLAMMSGLARSEQNTLRPTSAKEVLILSWCGMRGLAPLALALALAVTLADGTPFPARSELLVIACAVLLATLVLPGPAHSRRPSRR